jgi:hypothetical protein
MGSGSRLSIVPFRRPDWPHDLPSQWALSFEKTAVKLYIRDITRSTLVKSAFYFFFKPSNSGDDGWTDKSMAELEKELGLALKK